MFNGQNTEDYELDLQVISEDESDGNTQTTNDGEEESADSSVNLTEDVTAEKLSPAEISAKQQEDSWLVKVISGKSEVKDAPQWLQSKINSRLEAMNAPQNTEEIVKQALAKERKAQEFSDEQKKIPLLTKTQAKELEERYSQLKGADNVVALRTVLDAMGLSQKIREAEARGIAKGKISMPRSGQPAIRQSDESIGGVPLDVIHDDKKWNQMIRQGQI